MRSEHVPTAVATRVVAVAGNPNCGKTTLFNGLTGGRQRVGNWPGVTVEKKEGIGRVGGAGIRFIDLPGIYSLSAYSEDERVARDYLLGGEPELVIDIVDATNLERNLYLTTHLLEMKSGSKPASTRSFSRRLWAVRWWRSAQYGSGTSSGCARRSPGRCPPRRRARRFPSTPMRSMRS
jgi:hypothetical protein